MIFNRLKLAVDRVIAAFSVAVMLALVVCVVWQVFSRYVLNQPSTLTDELARFLMIWVGLLGAAYTVGAQRHLSIDLFALALNKRKQLLLSIVINVLILGFAGSVIVTGGLKLIDKTLATSQVSAAMQIPMGYVYIIGNGWPRSWFAWSCERPGEYDVWFHFWFSRCGSCCRWWHTESHSDQRRL